MDHPQASQNPQKNEEYTWLSEEHEQGVMEEDLLQISKDLSAVVVRAESDKQIPRRLLQAWKAIVRTAALAHISQSHRAAACNALCGYLEKCSSSPVQILRASGLIQSQWQDLFDIYLDQSVHCKSKPMKRVLATLSAVLRTSLDPLDALALRNSAVSRLIGIIWGIETYQRVKPALQALAYFTAKRIILVEDLINIYQSWSRQRQTVHEDEDVEVPLLNVFKGAKTPTTAIYSSWDTSVVTFVLTTLRWISHHDLAPAAGHIASTFFQELHEQASEGLKYRHSVTHLPLWVEVLQRSILHDPNVLESYKHHVFPALFKVNSSDFRTFLEYLGLKELRSELFLTTLSPSALLLFASLQVGKELGMVKEHGPLLKHENPHEAHWIALPNLVLDQLLINSHASTRCSALSILVTSTSNTKPFTADVLSILQQRLPHLHAETDAHFRNEILSTEQHLIDRLRGASSYIHRESARQETLANRKKQLADGKSNTALTPADVSLNSQTPLEQHMDFVEWYTEFLMSELRPAVPYQRHISSLNALCVVLRSGLDDHVNTGNLPRPTQAEAKWFIHVHFVNASSVRTLLDLLLDPFDDVRSLAATLLKMIPATYAYLWEPMDRFLSRAQSMYQRSGRADHADGVARGFEIMYSLHKADGLAVVEKLVVSIEEKLAIASRNLTSAVSGAPIHGELAGLRSILDQAGFYSSVGTLSRISSWKHSHKRIIRCCERVWECVRHVLCDDSPEGFLLEDADAEVDIDTKGVLSWAWRALKEASILLRTMMAKATHSSDNETSILESIDIHSTGSNMFVQLTQLRHRGAFSVVSVTFAACCKRCSLSDDIGLVNLPRLWYRDTLLRIRDQGAAFTRRSAGIPSLIVGILISDGNGDLFHTAIMDLQKEACKPVQLFSTKEEINLPQVHALNCLKSIFTNTKLAGCSEPFLPKTLKLAIDCFGSDVWAIRNCGMMLFQALIDRLSGVGRTEDESPQHQDIQLSGSLYESHPELTRLLLEILGASKSSDFLDEITTNKVKKGHHDSSATVEAVFPALEIVRRVGIPRGYTDEIIKLVLHHLGSSAWQIRVAAARTMSVILPGQTFARQISWLLNGPWASTNARHGKLLCAKIVVSRYFKSTRGSPPTVTYSQSEDGKLSVSGDLSEVVNTLQNWYTTVFLHDKCPFTRSAFLNIVIEFVVAFMQNGGSSTQDYPAGAFAEIWSSLYDILNGVISGQHLEYQHTPTSTWAAGSLLRRANVCLASLANSCLEKRHERLGDLLTTLAWRDPDSASGVIEMLGSLVDSMFETSLKPLAVVFADVMQNQRLTSVRTTAATNLADLLEKRPDLASASLLKSEEQGVIPSLRNPLAASADLRLRGSALALKPIQCAAAALDIAANISALGSMLKLAIHEKKDFSTRYAAVQSLQAIRHHTLKAYPSFLDLLLVLYDTLIDDDEDIRDKGAEIASVWLSTEHELSLTPLAARGVLLEFLASRYTDSEKLCLEALQRLTNSQSFTDEAQITSAKVVLDGMTIYFHPTTLLFTAAMEDDTSLFVQEKQNLFIDETKEAESWSCILKQINLSAVGNDVIAEFEKWVQEGLSLVLESMKNNVDGPLGWTTKPEMFLLGIRIVLGADVIMHWARGGQTGISEQLARKTLVEIASHGRQNALNGFWQRLMDSILTTSG